MATKKAATKKKVVSKKVTQAKVAKVLKAKAEKKAAPKKAVKKAGAPKRNFKKGASTSGLVRYTSQMNGESIEKIRAYAASKGLAYQPLIRAAIDKYAASLK